MGLYDLSVHSYENMVSSLKQRTLSRAIIGYETQWYAAAADALARLGEELELSDVQQYYSEQCTAGRELFMREWNRKTLGYYRTASAN